jgi:hypothetical protein
MNPAPDAELASVGEFYHNWITNTVTNLVFKRLNEQREAPRYRWNALLSPEPTRTFAVASQVEQQSRTIVPSPTDSGNTEARAAAAVAEPKPEASARRSSKKDKAPQSK